MAPENVGESLPYRCGASELAAWAKGRARGVLPRPSDLGAGEAKAAEGAATTARAMGLADAAGTLTPEGTRFALAPAAGRAAILRVRLRAFPPYRELLAAAADPGGTTEASWIETWWATKGYGSSISNRREAVATFGRLVEFAGLGRYVAGRRGHPTRIEWAGSADAVPPSDAAGASGPAGGAVASATGSAPEPGRADAAPETRPEQTASPAPPSDSNRVVVPLGGGRSARLEVPFRLPRAEKRRLLELLELLIAEE